MSLKCSMSKCTNDDRRLELITCKSFCSSSFHGTCLGLERNWQSSRLKDYFVCEECLNMQIVGKKYFDAFSVKLDSLSDEQNTLVNKCSKVIEFNSNSFSDLCQRIDENQSLSSLCSNDANLDNVLKIIVQQIDAMKRDLHSLKMEFRDISKKFSNAPNMNQSNSITDSAIKEELADIKQTVKSLSLMISQNIDIRNTATNSETNILANSGTSVPAENNLPADPAEPGAGIVFKRGSNWTLQAWTDWNARINRLREAYKQSPSSTKVLKSIYIRGLPIHSKKAWLSDFIQKNFNGEILKYTDITPKNLDKNKPRYKCAKIEVSSTISNRILSSKNRNLWNKIKALAVPWVEKELNSKKTNLNRNNNINNTRISTNNSLDTNKLVNNNSKKSSIDNNKLLTNNSKKNRIASNIRESLVKEQNPSGFQSINNNKKIDIYKNIPSTSTDHNYSNFEKSVDYIGNITGANNVTSNNVSPNFVNPMLPPIVRLTQNSIGNGDSVYVLSRFRDPRIYDNVRLFLAYLYNQENHVCMDGKTKTNVQVLIHQEGLPSNYEELMGLYIKYHDTLGITEETVKADLKAYCNHISSKRTNYLNRTKSNHDKFFRPDKQSSQPD